MPEESLHEREVESIEHRAVIQARATPHPQGVARDLALLATGAHRKVTGAAAHHLWSGGAQGGGQWIEHPRMDRIDRRQRRFGRPDERPHQASRADHHRQPTARPPVHRRPRLIARIEVHLFGQTTRRTDHDRGSLRHPHAGDRAAKHALVGGLEQCLVEREVLTHARETDVEPLDGLASTTDRPDRPRRP